MADDRGKSEVGTMDRHILIIGESDHLQNHHLGYVYIY